MSSSPSGVTCTPTPRSRGRSCARPGASRTASNRRACEPRLLAGTGLVCDIGPDGPTVALRGDLDALPLVEATGLPFTSPVAGACHACGHDVHTTVVLGAGLVLAELDAAGRLPGRVRLIFQPAEETTPGGALDVLAAGGLDGVDRAYALHCDPRTDVGRIGSRAGAITAAADHVTVALRGHGGHTSRPHLTDDVVFALGQVIVGAPAVISRRIDPRAGAALVWGAVNAGSGRQRDSRRGKAHRHLPLPGQRRVGAGGQPGPRRGALDHGAVRRRGRGLVRAGGSADRERRRRRPDHRGRGAGELGAAAVELTPQSLGGEDFAWMLEKVPGAMVRLGTRTSGGPTYDLHRPDLVVDERAVGIGVRVLVATAVRDLSNCQNAGSVLGGGVGHGSDNPRSTPR